MKKLFSFFIALWILLIPSAVRAEDIEASYWNMDGVLEDNGDLHITEKYEYRFDDDFNGFFRSVSTRGSDGLEDIRVTQWVGDERIPYTHSQDARNGDTGFFSLTREGDLQVIKIFSPADRGDVKTFEISYINKNVALRQADTAEIHYSFLSDGNEIPADAMDITLTLPGKPVEGVRTYLNAPKSSGDVSYADGVVTAHLTKVSAGSEVTLRTLFPLTVLPNGTRTGNQRFDDIVAGEEAILQKEIDRARTVATWTSLSYLISGAVLLITLVGILSTRSRPGDPMEFGDPLTLLPGEVSALVSGSSIDTIFNATLFDFVRRGVLRVENEGSLKQSNIVFHRTDSSTAILKDFEKLIYDFFMKRVGNGSRFRMFQVGSYINRETGYEDLRETTRRVKQSIKRFLTEEGYYKGSSHIIAFMIILVLIAILSTGLLIYGVGPSFLTIILAIVGVVVLATIPKLSSKGKTHKKYFTDLKSDLKNNAPISIDPELALVYSIALGIDGGELEDYAPEYRKEDSGYNSYGERRPARAGGYFPPWFTYYVLFSRDDRYSHAYRSTYTNSSSSGGGSGGGGFSGSSGGGGGGGF